MVSIFSISINLVVFNVISRVSRAMRIDARMTHRAPLVLLRSLLFCLLFLLLYPHHHLSCYRPPVIVYRLAPRQPKKKKKKVKPPKKLFLGLLLLRLVTIEQAHSIPIPKNPLSP
jgi:hypothetical protein